VAAVASCHHGRRWRDRTAIQVGDRIYERGRIGNQDFETSWKVVEYIRPSRVVLQSEKGSTRITYSFEARSDATVFTRELAYNTEIFAAVATTSSGAEQLMQSQSEQAVKQLKTLIEKILSGESIGIQ
jgi:hypothetical protein